MPNSVNSLWRCQTCKKINLMNIYNATILFLIFCFTGGFQMNTIHLQMAEITAPKISVIEAFHLQHSLFFNVYNSFSINLKKKSFIPFFKNSC